MAIKNNIISLSLAREVKLTNESVSKLRSIGFDTGFHKPLSFSENAKFTNVFHELSYTMEDYDSPEYSSSNTTVDIENTEDGYYKEEIATYEKNAKKINDLINSLREVIRGEEKIREKEKEKTKEADTECIEEIIRALNSELKEVESAADRLRNGQETLANLTAESKAMAAKVKELELGMKKSHT